jgi:hypothetical protein
MFTLKNGVFWDVMPCSSCTYNNNNNNNFALEYTIVKVQENQMRLNLNKMH